MSSSDNKPFWTEFIELYREQRCLWDVKSRNYSNKHLRKESFDVLITKCKEIFPNADEKFVKAKIDSMRASFRRELKKITSSKSTGKGHDEVYEPTLWYFDLLRFTTDQETARKGASSLQNFNLPDEPEDNNEMTDDNNVREDFTTILDGSNITNPSERSSATATPTSETGSRSLLQTSDPSSDTSSAGPRRQRKRKVVSELEQKKEDFLETATNALNRLNETTAFGSSVAFQLEDMERRQKIFAQKLISDILFHGKLGKLNEHSVFQLNNNPPYTPSFYHGGSNVQPTTHQFPVNNYGNFNSTCYQPYIPLQSTQTDAQNNTTVLNESTASNHSQTGTTGNLNTNGTTVELEDNENIGQYLIFNRLD